MPTCGYICPSCEGREIMDDGSPCPWCKQVMAESKDIKEKMISDEEWMISVHFGDCCSDPPIEK